MLPALSINRDLNNYWELNLKGETRQIWQEGTTAEDLELGWRHELVDLSLVATRRLGFDYDLTGGYLVRIQEGSWAHRLLQQLTLKTDFTDFRLSHRWRTDQTFERGAPPTFRLRYRLATEIPLRGQTTDVREFYLKGSNEYLASTEGSEQDLETRFVGVLGYQLVTKNKVELGADYRLDSFLAGPPAHTFWLVFNYYVSL